MKLNLKNWLFGNESDSVEVYTPEVEISTQHYLSLFSSCTAFVGSGTSMLSNPIAINGTGTCSLLPYDVCGDYVQPHINYHMEKVRCLHCGQWNHSYSLCCEFCGGRLE